MSEKKPKRTNIYHEILEKKLLLTVIKNKGFNFDIPKKAFDRIAKFYGKETLTPISFVLFNKKTESVEIQKRSTVSHALNQKELSNIYDCSNCFAFTPKYFHEKYNEVQIDQLSPKINNKAMKNIIKKSGINWDLIDDYCEVQIISTEVEEKTKIRITYELVESVFRVIPLLNIVMVDGKTTDLTYYSYKNILEKCGIKLEDMLPYLKTKISDIDRKEFMNQNVPIYEKVKMREIRDIIEKGSLKDKNIEIYLGNEPLNRYQLTDFDLVQKDGNEASNLLNELIEKVNNQKDKIQSYLEDVNNKIIEIKDVNNKDILIRRKIYDEIMEDPETKFDEYKTNDIYGNEIIISKKDLPNYEKNPNLVKIYNNTKPKEDFIFTDINEIEENLANFAFIRQEEIFKGKNKNEEPLEEEWLMMDVECGDLPELDESKPLFTIPEKEKLFEKTKSDLLEELKKDNKDLLLYHKKDNFIPVNVVDEIKDRDGKVKNKNIKYKIKNQINKDENIIVEYIDIFDEENTPECVLIKNEDIPDDNYVVNKNDLLNLLNEWEDPDSNINIKNEINNEEIEVNPHKIKIITLEKQEIPKNYEDIQEEIKKSITPENTIIKSNDKLIKKTIVKKIINNNDPNDTYYINDINGQKVKISKKQLEKDNEDPSCQFISVSTKEDPDKNIIISTQEIITQIDLDPMEESCSLKDKDGNNHNIRKTIIKINPMEIEDINFEDQPNKIKDNLVKDIKDYYYIYKDPENKEHYIRNDVLKLIKEYKSPYPIENFEVEDNKDNKFIIPKEDAVKLIDAPNEIKYISLDDEESNGEPIMADIDMFKKAEGDIDEPLPINKDGKKIKLKTVKLTKVKEIDSLGEQPEEKQYEIIYNLIKKIQKDNPSSDIYKVKDNQSNEIFIYEDTLNKIEENKSDPPKTTYKGNSPLKQEIICDKNVTKSSPNKYIKLVEPNTILDKNELEKSLKQYKPKEKTIKMKDEKGTEVEFDPLKVQVYEASPDETDITKILPADFSDINEKLLLDIVPQNKLVLVNDSNHQPVIIKKKEGDNLVKYPKTTFDTFVLFDKDGKKIKASRKNVENKANDNNCEYIEIVDNTNGENKNEIVIVKELEDALKDKENEDFEIKNREGKKIKLNKKKITIVKQNNKYIEIPEQGEEIKNKLLSDIKDSFIKVKDSKNNKDIILRNSQINEVNNHKQRAPFINYEVLNNKKEKVYITKDICKQKESIPNSEKLILCYDETQKDKEFLVPLDKIENSKLDADDQFDIGNNQKIIFKNLKIKKLNEAPKLGVQPEEEKMIEVINLINKINAGPLNKNYKTKDVDGNPCFVSNNYINKLKTESKNDEKDTKYKVNDAFGKNKIDLTKLSIDKDNKPGDYIIIKSKKDNKDYLVDLKDLLNNLKNFKSTDDDITLTNSVDNKPMKLNPLDIEVVPPYDKYPLQKIIAKKEVPEKKDENLNIDKEKPKEEERRDRRNEKDNKDKDEIKERIRLRSAPAKHRVPEKKSYKIRRAIIYKKQKK